METMPIVTPAHWFPPAEVVLSRDAAQTLSDHEAMLWLHALTAGRLDDAKEHKARSMYFRTKAEAL